MKKYLSIFFLFFLFFSSKGQGVTFKTVSFLNSKYLASKKWDASIPLKNQSHDVNNLTYGGIYHPPISVELQSKEDRNTIARGFMIIEVDLINTTNKNLVLSQIDLKIKQKFTKPNDGKALEWEIGSRSSGYNPHFLIDGESNIYTHSPKDFVLAPAGNPQDTRIPLEVECNEPDAIWLFEFELSFIDPSNPFKKIKVSSDKHYFVASE